MPEAVPVPATSEKRSVPPATIQDLDDVVADQLD